MNRIVQMLAVAVLLSPAAGAFAQGVDMPKLVGDLKQGGHVIVFRHGATHRDQADTDPLNLDNVAKQRQLNDSGRDVAKQVGEALKKLGVPVGPVYTSRFNRAVETGKLVSGGNVTPLIDVSEGGQVVTPAENDRRAAAMRTLAATVPPAGKNTVIVSHKPNIMDAFGKDWFDLREGEASIFRPDGTGKAVFIARVPAPDWVKAASK